MALVLADDLLIRIERAIDLHQRQMVASIYQKKLRLVRPDSVIDIPIGTTANIQFIPNAESLKKILAGIAKKFGIETKILFTDGSQPIGKGIGPAFEAQDVWAVLTGNSNAPKS